jgi:sugar phosphate isomerase/epimerase
MEALPAVLNAGATGTAARRGLSAIGLILGLAGCTQLQPPAGPPAVPALKLGLQAYTFRRYTFAQTLDKAAADGFAYIQAYPKQSLGGGLPGTFDYRMDAGTREKLLAMAREKGITVSSYGVVIGKSEDDWRAIFTFAKAMGFHDIASEPPQAEMALVDRLARESGVAVALHNHPTPNRYANLDTALAAIAAFGPELGICGDTGHWARSGYDPVENLRRAGPRLMDVHFKDLNERGVRTAHDVPWGTGVCDAAGQIAVLRQMHFPGVVYMEYEHDTPQLEREVAASAEYFRRAVRASLPDLQAGKVLPYGYSDDVADAWSVGRGMDSPRWPVPQALVLDRRPGTAADVDEAWTKEPYGDFALSLTYTRAVAAAKAILVVRCPDPEHWRDTGVPVPLPAGAVGKAQHLVVAADGGQIVAFMGGKQVFRVNRKKLGHGVPAKGLIGLSIRGGTVNFDAMRVDAVAD